MPATRSQQANSLNPLRNAKAVHDGGRDTHPILRVFYDRQRAGPIARLALSYRMNQIRCAADPLWELTTRRCLTSRLGREHLSYFLFPSTP